MPTLLSYDEALRLVQASDRSFLGEQSIQKTATYVLGNLHKFPNADWSYHRVNGGTIRAAYSRGQFLFYEF